VVHSKLCLKLTSFGFQGKLLHWIAAFLHSRTQSVGVGKYYSDPVTCTLLFPEISTWNSLLERLVKCSTVQTFRRHLDRIDVSKLILTNRVHAVLVSVAAYCCFLFFYFFLFFWVGGKYQCLFRTFLTP